MRERIALLFEKLVLDHFELCIIGALAIAAAICYV